MGNYVIGEYAHNIDDKGRLIIPAKFRGFLGDQFVVTKGLDQCLFVFPMGEWQAFEDKLKALPIADKGARAFTRFFFASASECSLDKQGRIPIVPALRKFAGLKKAAVVVGVTSRLEIWDQEAWDCYNSLDATDFADQMAALGI